MSFNLTGPLAGERSKVLVRVAAGGTATNATRAWLLLWQLESGVNLGHQRMPKREWNDMTHMSRTSNLVPVSPGTSLKLKLSVAEELPALSIATAVFLPA